MRYTWILFDADGTLFDYDAAEAAALRTGFSRLGRPFPSEHADVYRMINGRMWIELENGATTQARLRVERFEKLFEALGIDGNPARFSEDYLADLARRTELIDGAGTAVAALADVARLMLITNGLAEVQRPRFAASSIHRHFADLVISEEVGAAKPDPRIFDAAFEKMGRPLLSQVLMVGDSLTSDIKGGNDYGIDTCWFNADLKPLDHGITPTFEIRHLGELWDLIGGS